MAARPARPAGHHHRAAGLLDAFVAAYNHHRPHRSLPHRATPAAARPKATPGTSRARDTHDRLRHDTLDKAGCVTLRLAGRLHHIGIGRTHTGTHVLLLVQDLHIRVIHATTGELLRDLILDPRRDYRPPAAHPAQPRKALDRTDQSSVRAMPMSCDITERARQDSNLWPGA
jgi:hypothetical protein